MAIIFKRPRSPFWYVQWRDPASKTVKRFATEFRHDSTKDLREAIKLRQDYELREIGDRDDIHSPGRFAAWVAPYLQARYANSPKTLTRIGGTWKLMTAYFEAMNITHPRQLTRAHCLAYPDWRSKVPHLNGRKPVSYNTIILELKVLGTILFEAVNREFTTRNPASRLNMKRVPARIKDELEDHHVEIIRREIHAMVTTATTPPAMRRADFLFVSFEIARHQSLRLSETYFPIESANLKTKRIQLIGKGQKSYDADLNPALIPLLERLKEQGRKFTYAPPHIPSLVWFKFFTRLRAKYPEFKNISFHSTRVTVVSRMERAGAPEHLIMKGVSNHGSTTVHRMYRRTKQAELEAYWPHAASLCSLDTLSHLKNPDESPAT